jgi:WD40 repeat protein
MPVMFSSDGKTLVTGGAGDTTIRFWSVAAGQEMLVFKDAELVSHIYSTPADKFLVWQERGGPIRVTTLPTLAEIDAAQKKTEEETQ